MKTCFKCGQCKALSAFYKHKGMADGHLNKCKECTKSDVWHHRRDNVERIREYDRDRSRLAHRVAARVKNTAEYRAKFPERYAANAAVSRALRNGSLVRMPCFMCGCEETEAHHPDYSTPLLVTWLCTLHHRELHLAYPEDHYHRTS